MKKFCKQNFNLVRPKSGGILTALWKSNKNEHQLVWGPPFLRA